MMESTFGHVKILETLKPFFAEMARRRNALRKRLLAIICSGVVLSVFIWIFMAEQSHGMPRRFYLIPVPTLIGLLYARFASRRYSDRYKTSTYSAATNITFPTIRYVPTGVMPQVIYANCDLFDRRPDIYKGEDLFSGTINGVKVAFSEVHTLAKVKDAKGKVHEQTLFKGTLFQAEFSKQLQHVTTVMPNGPFSTAQFARPLNGIQRAKIASHDGDFSRMFSVYSSDADETHTILNTAFADRIVALVLQFDRRPLRLSFVGNRLTLAVPYGKGRFDAGLWTSAGDMDNMHFFVQQVSAFANVIDMMKRTKQLWVGRSVAFDDAGL